MFQHLSDTLTHPAALPVIGMLLLVLLVFLTLSVVSPGTEQRKRQFSDNPLMNALGWIGVVLALPVLIILIAAAWELFVLAWNYPPLKTDASEIRWHSSLMLAMLAAIGAIFTLGFAYIRVFTTERQTRTAEDQAKHNELVLLNGRTQGALELLSARMTETRIGRTVAYKKGKQSDSALQWQDEAHVIDPGWDEVKLQDWQVFELQVPDIQTRLSGIGQLAAIIEEYPDRRRSINEHLANFIRANAPLENAEVYHVNPPPDWLATSDKEFREWGDGLRDWANTLTLRKDIQAAIALIGTSTSDDQTKGLDLRRVNLQGADLSGAFLEEIRFEEAQMQGAGLVQAQMQGAIFFVAQMRGANLYRAQMQGAIFYDAEMQKTHLFQAQMQGAHLFGARMQGAILAQAQMQGADLGQAQMQGADLAQAQMDTATSLMDEVFYDGSVTFAEGIIRVPDREATLEWGDFDTQWRDWQKSIGFDPPQDQA